MPASQVASVQKLESPGSVASVIVAYNPDLPALQEIVSVVATQVSKVILLDNGSSVPVGSLLSLGVNTLLIRLSENSGLGSAQNRGIKEAKKFGCECILFLDQDSLPSKEMVGKLVEAMEFLLSQGNRIAAVGPRHVDPRRGRYEPKPNSEWPDPERPYSAYLPTDFLLSSGSLVPLDVLDDIGLMDPSLFIDSTDRDWCFRAIHKGYKLYRCVDSTLTHKRGDHVRCIWPTPKLYEAVHQPQRLYFIMRNRVLLYQRSYVPIRWILADIPRALGKIALAMIFGPERPARLRFIFVGVWHGIRGRTGPMRLID